MSLCSLLEAVFNYSFKILSQKYQWPNLCWSINYSPQLCLIIQITATTVCTLGGKHPLSPGIILIPSKLHISSLKSSRLLHSPVAIKWRPFSALPWPATMGMAQEGYYWSRGRKGYGIISFPGNEMKSHGSGTKEKGNSKASFSRGLVGWPEGFCFATDFCVT